MDSFLLVDLDNEALRLRRRCTPVRTATGVTPEERYYLVEITPSIPGSTVGWADDIRSIVVSPVQSQNSLERIPEAGFFVDVIAVPSPLPRDPFNDKNLARIGTARVQRLPSQL